MHEDIERENKKLSDQVQELTQEVEKLKKELFLSKKVIEESKDIYQKSKTALRETAAKLNNLAEDFEEPRVRTITDYLGVTNAMRHYESCSTLPGSTDDSQSDHSKEPDSKSSENSDTKTITNVKSLDDMLHSLTQDGNTTMKSSHIQLEDLVPNKRIDSPTSSITSSIPSSITSSEMSDYSSHLEHANQTRTRSSDSSGFAYSTEATKSSSEYESDGDQATLRPKTRKKEIVTAPLKTGFFNRKNNWPIQTDKTALPTRWPAKEEPTMKDELTDTKPPNKKELAVKEEATDNKELPAQEETELEKVLKRITGKTLQKKK